MIKLRNLLCFVLTIVCFWYQKSCNWYQKLVPDSDTSFLLPVSGQYVIRDIYCGPGVSFETCVAMKFVDDDDDDDDDDDVCLSVSNFT